MKTNFRKGCGFFTWEDMAPSRVMTAAIASRSPRSHMAETAAQQVFSVKDAESLPPFDLAAEVVHLNMKAV